MSRYGSGLTVLSLAALAAGGCQRAEFAFYPVEGTVTRGGRPLPNIQVVFLADPDAGTVGPRAIGKTDAAGRYRLRTDQGDDGAVAGTHRVVVLDLDARAQHSRPVRGAQRNEVARGAPEDAQRLGDEPKATPRVPPGYRSVSQTPLRAKVGPGPQTLDFEIP
jgi:hypothetical protein